MQKINNIEVFKMFRKNSSLTILDLNINRINNIEVFKMFRK